MYTERKPIQQFLVKAYCGDDYCSGELQHTGLILTSHPAQYPHECRECRKVHTLETIYPKIEYEEVK